MCTRVKGCGHEVVSPHSLNSLQVCSTAQRAKGTPQAAGSGLAGLVLSLSGSAPCEKLANGDVHSTRNPATEPLGSWGLLCVTL